MFFSWSTSPQSSIQFGFENKLTAQERFQAVGDGLKEERIQHLKDQMAFFKSSLEKFALDYRKEIRSNPEFRADFHMMCANIGVDPLASNKVHASFN